MTQLPDLTIGIEEEYLLVDRDSRDLATSPPDAFMRECEKQLPGRVANELMQCQVEVETSPCRTVGEARQELQFLRGTIAAIAGQFGLAPIAASTHPKADWADQEVTHKARYEGLASDLGVVAGRMLICGMHVHAGIKEPDLRIDLMNQMTYFLPHLLALSTSSPFWQGRDTGLMSYRLSVFDSLPRSGLPDRFDSYVDYRNCVDHLVNAGVIENGTKIWWDIRPSENFPTLESRVTDICTRLEDCLTIAALYQCLLHMLMRLKSRNQHWRIYPRTLVAENRWRAQRYGITDGLIDFGRGELVPASLLVDELIDLLAEDAEALHCTDEIARARDIVRLGTSAQMQRKIYQQSVEQAGEDQALRNVVDWLIAETVAGL